MKKIVFLAAALIVAISAATAGNNRLPFISMGVKAGISTMKNDINLSAGPMSLDLREKKTTGYHAGLVIRFELPVVPIYIQPELLYNWNKYKTNMPATSPVKFGDVKLNSFNVPLMIGVGFGSKKILQIRANLGPVFNLASSAKVGDLDTDTFKDAINEAFKYPSVTWAAGLGLDIIGITFDVRYNAQFGKMKSTNNSITLTTKPQGWTFSLGYLF